MTHATVYPGARYEPIDFGVNRGSNGPFKATPLGIVLHCNAAHSGDLHDFEENNLDEGPTSHFQLQVDGTLDQYIPLDWTSWCQTDGNDTYWSIETSGLATELLTEPQITTLVSLLRWLHEEWGMPLQLADVPGELGFGWHGMGSTPAEEAKGIDWGHSVCPGIRKDQRQQVLDLALGADMTLTTADAELVADTILNKTAFPSSYYKDGDGKPHGMTLSTAVDAAAFYAQAGYGLVKNNVLAELTKLEAADQDGSPAGSVTVAQVEQVIDTELAKLHLVVTA